MNRDWDKLKPIGKQRKLPEETSPDERGGMTAHLQIQLWHQGWLQLCYDALVPGGVIKAFSATRTFHRLAQAMENVGFEMVPGKSIEAWCFASGFPKSLDLSKAIDAHLGKSDERPVVGTSRGVKVPEGFDHEVSGTARGAVGIKQVGIDVPVTAAATTEAARFEGWGTALKPAFEPFLVGRKPLNRRGC